MSLLRKAYLRISIGLWAMLMLSDDWAMMLPNDWQGLFVLVLIINGLVAFLMVVAIDPLAFLGAGMLLLLMCVAWDMVRVLRLPIVPSLLVYRGGSQAASHYMKVNGPWRWRCLDFLLYL